MSLQIQPVDLLAPAHEIVTAMRRRDPERRVAVTIEEGLAARGDEALLRSVLENLLENAWKFTARTDEAKIAFGARAEAGGVVYFVRDNGAGFDPAYAKDLFRPFERLHKESDVPGTGVGLAIVQRIVRRHGGRIWADGAPGQGATFEPRGGRMMGGARDATSDPRCAVLIVEHDADIAETVAFMLEDRGYRADVATNGREALDRLHRGPRPSLILLDLTMPIMDGRDFRRAQLQTPELASIPAVVVTADAAAADATLGATAWRVKPVALDELLETVARHCAVPSAALPDGPRP